MVEKLFQWLKTRRMNKLQIKLAGKKEKLRVIEITCKGQTIPYYVLEQIAELREEIVSLEKRIELL